MCSKSTKEKKEEKFEYLATIDLRFCLLENPQNELERFKIKDSKELFFKLVDTRGKFFLFKAESPTKAQAWKTDLGKAVDEAKSSLKIPQSYNDQVKQQLHFLKTIYSEK